MAKKKPAIDTSKLNQIDAYTYEEYDRANNPPVGLAGFDTVASPEAKYEYDPHIDPSLQWAGKKEGASFEVATTSIHIHESIKPHKIIRSVQTMGDDYQDDQGWLFESDVERAQRRNNEIEFYQHKNKWTNRLIAGDSLVIMNSLLEKEGMAGQVQMVYIDPPYGIKYGSNFQPFVNKRDVKDKKDEDLSTEPEMIKAFRDTWELGIHSYLTYLRDRLLLAKDLLSETGSVFVQISDENVHHVREICDEVLGVENFVSIITVRKTGSVSSPDAKLNTLGTLGDFIVWYAKKITSVKYHQLFLKKLNSDELFSQYNLVERNGEIKRLSIDELKALNEEELMNVIQSTSLESNGYAESFHFPVNFYGKSYYPAQTRHWSTTENGIKNLIAANRILATENKLRYKRKSGLYHLVYLTPLNEYLYSFLNKYSKGLVLTPQIAPLLTD